MTGVWRNENGVPLTRVKKLAPAMSPRQVDEMRGMWRARQQADRADARKYQKERRHRITLGRDIFNGIEQKPRHILPPGFGGIPPRTKKPITINTESGAMMEAAMDGVINEPGTPTGDRDWEKYKREVEKGKRNFNKITLPDD